MFTLGIPSLSLTSMASRGGAGVLPVVGVSAVPGFITVSGMPRFSAIVATAESGAITVAMPTISNLEAA